MTLARALDIFTVLEQPVRESTGGMELLPEFRTMADTFPVPCLESSACILYIYIYRKIERIYRYANTLIYDSIHTHYTYIYIYMCVHVTL